MLGGLDDPVAIDEKVIVRGLEVSLEDHARHEISVGLEVDFPDVVIADFCDCAHRVVPCFPANWLRKFDAYEITLMFLRK